MKNVKKLLKKAMVFTVAASMLVGTPLTASAAGIRGVYSVSDGTNDDIDHEGDSSHTGTVTNTDTNTNSGVIKDNDASIIGIVLDKDYVNAEKGVKETLKASIVIDGDLVDGDKTQDAIIKELENKIKWEVTYADGTTVQNNVAASKVLSIAASAADRTVVTLNPRQGTKAGEEMIVKATIDGSYRFYKDEAGNIVKEELKEGYNKTEDYTAEAKVFIKEYSEALVFDGDPATEVIDEMPTPYLKHVLDLNDYLVRTPATANDTITWISSDTKVATVTAAGVVTFKKVGSSDIYAVGEKGVKAVWTATVEAGTPASKVVIIDPQSEREDKLFANGKNQTKKADVDIRDDEDWEKDAEVVMYAKVKAAVDAAGNLVTSEEDLIGTKDGDAWKKITSKTVEIEEGTAYIEVSKDNKSYVVKDSWEITDTITWTSNKPAIVSVDGKDREAVMYANGVGTAVITAKASNGKSDKLTVAVKATLNSLDITNTEDELFSGQSLQMTFDRDPEENKDGVKWSIAKVGKYKNGEPELDSNDNQKQMNHPNASINSKGVLTIKPKLDLSQDEYQVVTVVLQSKTTKTVKNEDGKDVKVPLAEDTYDITISQSSIDGITVKDDAGKQIANVVLDGTKLKTNKDIAKADNTTEISVPKNRTYTATVTESEKYEGGADTLTWKTSNAKVASITYAADGTAKITANAKGTATITVSGVRVTERNGKESAGVIKTTFKVSVKQPVKTVTLNKPTVVLNEKTKKVSGKLEVQNQKVALKATLGPKGVNTKEAVHWSVKQNGTELEATKDLGLLDKQGKVTKTSISVNLPTPQVGDVFEITARTDSGAFATSTVTIVNKTTSVAIASEELGTDKKPVLFKGMDGKKEKDNVKTAVVGDEFKMYPCINIGTTSDTNFYTAGENNCENVTYSVNKKGIVSIDSDGTVHAINKGTVTITAKTPLGKKATLKVIVGLPQQ